MGRPVNRITPKMPAQNMQTYKLSAPITTHRRKATCEEAGCLKNAHGWRMHIDQSTQLGRDQADYIKNHSGRAYTATKIGDTLFELVFKAGQQCFAEHTVSLEREPIYLVKKGDHRMPQGAVRRHVKAEHWIEDMSENQDKLKTIIEKG